MPANVLTNCGCAWLTGLMYGSITPTSYYVGWGEGTGIAAKTDTTLFSEVQSRIIAGSSISAFNQIQWISTLTASAVRSITNAGVFSSDSGTLLVKGDFSTVALANQDRIEFTITITST